MDSIETFEDKVRFLALMEYSQEEITAHVLNGTAELLADIEGVDDLVYVSPPMGGWITSDGDEVVAIHSDRDKAYDEVDRWGATVRFDLFAVPTHGYYPVEQRPLVNGRYVTYGEI